MSVFFKCTEVRYLYYDINYCSETEWKRLLRAATNSTLEHFAFPCSTRVGGGAHMCVPLRVHLLTGWPFVSPPVELIMLFILGNSLDELIPFLQTLEHIHHFTDMKCHVSAKKSLYQCKLFTGSGV